MKEHNLIASGFGGQGIMLIGQIIATAAMFENKHSTWLPSYGPEMRGGTANCTVVVSDEEIGSPVTSNPNELIIMNIPSLLKFEPQLKKSGLMIINTSIVDRKTKRDDIDVVYVNANDIAEQLGNLKVANMVILGTYMGKTNCISLESVEKAFKKKLTGRKAKLIDLNIEAVKTGIEYVK